MMRMKHTAICSESSAVCKSSHHCWRDRTKLTGDVMLIAADLLESSHVVLDHGTEQPLSQ